MGDSTLTVKQQDKLTYLRRICEIYAKFQEQWSDVFIIHRDHVIFVIWFRLIKPKGVEKPYMYHTMRQFPIGDISKRINKYKDDVRREFSLRHENKRLIKEREKRQSEIRGTA